MEHLLQNAAGAIRDMKCGSLQLEQLKTAIYHDICQGITKCADYAYGYLPDCKPPPGPTPGPRSSPHSPPRGGGEGRGSKKAAGSPKEWSFAADLDLLK